MSQGRKDNKKSGKGRFKSATQFNLNQNATVTGISPQQVRSIETIYKNAVEKRMSSSSDEIMELSGEFFEPNDEFFFPEHQQAQSGKSVQNREKLTSPSVMNRSMARVAEQSREESPEEKALNQIREAEASKARMFPPTGETPLQVPFDLIAKLDQDYEVVANHVDEATQQKIVKGEYIDFSKLLPRNKILVEEEGYLELIMKNGKAFWSPFSETVSISGFNHWEQAFRIYSNIYTKAYPHRASELIQYNHIIYTISLSYAWDNVYLYDKEFRLHLSKHPERSWAVILQQAYSMRLKDQLNLPRVGDSYATGSSPHGNGSFNSNNKKNSTSLVASIIEANVNLVKVADMNTNVRIA